MRARSYKAKVSSLLLLDAVAAPITKVAPKSANIHKPPAPKHFLTFPVLLTLSCSKTFERHIIISIN